MPVTTTPAPHEANVWAEPARFPNDLPIRTQHEEHLLASACSAEYQKNFNGRILASSFTIDEASPIYAFENGFVNGAIHAYAGHHHLIIRPEDIWFAILAQLSLFVNANNEGLRSRFVADDSLKDLAVVQMATLQNTDFRRMAFDMSKVLQDNVVDSELRKWVLPAFSTTRKLDEDVASVIILGSMQSYFRYSCFLTSGHPSVTLLGERSDWEDILSRLDKLRTFGPEPTVWHNLLKPILSAFVDTFNAPDSPVTKSFWQNITRVFGDGGFHNISGWITAFCFWDAKGRPLYTPNLNPPFSNKGPLQLDPRGPENRWFDLSGVYYHTVCAADIAPGWSSVPLTVVDGLDIYNTRIVAGSVGVKVSSRVEGSDLDTLQPVSGWWIFESNPKGQTESVVDEARRTGQNASLTDSLEDEFKNLGFRAN